jgi:hypothetical protein
MSLDCFKHHIPRWGGKSDFGDKILNATEKFHYINTCTIDYYLLAMWLSSKLSNKILFDLKTKASTETILEIINAIERNNWNRAKTLWLFDFCRRNKDGSCIDHDTIHVKTICTFGTEFNHFYKHVSFLQSVIIVEKCNLCNIDYSSQKTFEYFYLKRQEEKIILNIQDIAFCDKCEQMIEKKFNFVHGDPCWLICEIDTHLELTYDALPQIINLNNKNYRLLCSSFNVDGKHFQSVFYLNKKCFLIDDMNIRNIPVVKDPLQNRIVTCFYCIF